MFSCVVMRRNRLGVGPLCVILAVERTRGVNVLYRLARCSARLSCVGAEDEVMVCGSLLSVVSVVVTFVTGCSLVVKWLVSWV